METGYKLVDSAIETGNYKLALKLIEKKIKEQPNSSHCIATKCFILSNSALNGSLETNTEEVLQMCLDLAKKVPSDPKTIKLLSATFDLLDYTPKEDLYEVAMRKYQNTSLAFEWFQTTIHKNDLVGMQKATMALSKSFKVDTDNGRMIKLWAAVSMVLVVNCCKNDGKVSNGKDVLLATLGLKLIEAVEGVSPHGLNAQEMFIKCQLLLRKGETTQCIQELKLFLEKESDLELLLLYFELLKEAEMWEPLYNVTTHYLVDTGVDDWDTWKLAILAAKKLDRKHMIVEVIKSYKIGRNSALAAMYVLDAAETKERETAFKNYLTKYLHKLCCFLDLRSFLDDDFISRDSALSILEKEMNEKVPTEILGNKKATEKELNILVNYVKIKARLDQTNFESNKFFKQCCDYYNATKHLENKLAEYDYYAGFEFLALAMQTYITINKNLADQQSILNLIVLIENDLIKNKYEFHMLLWLAHLYLNTNMSAPLKRIFDTLKIKNVQVDTLSPHFINHMATRTRSNDLLSKCLGFYTHNVAAEMPPMVMNCFEKQTFSKLQGFVEFKARVENSITHYELVLESIQHTRLNSDKASDSITINYIPMLKEAYRIISCDGNDVTTKLHDNIDQKILWDCGDHKPHDAFSSFLNSTMSRVYNDGYVKINILKELLTYDQHSRVWNDYKTRFINLINDDANLVSFSSVERNFLKSFGSLLNSDNNTELDLSNVKPSNPIDPIFNHYYLLLQDWDRVLTTLKKRSSKKTFFGQKENVSKISHLQKTIQNALKELDRDELAVSAKAQLKLSKAKSLEWFSNDEFGKEFKVPVDVINKCYKNFEADLLKNLREI